MNLTTNSNNENNNNKIDSTPTSSTSSSSSSSSLNNNVTSINENINTLPSSSTTPTPIALASSSNTNNNNNNNNRNLPPRTNYNNNITFIQYFYYFYHYYKEQYQRNPSLFIFLILSFISISASVFFGLPISSFLWLSGLIISTFILLQAFLLLISGRQLQRNPSNHNNNNNNYHRANIYPGRVGGVYPPLNQNQQHPQQPQDGFYFSRFSHLMNPSLNLQLTLIDRDFNSNDYEMLLALDNQNTSKGATQEQIDLLPFHFLESKKDLESLLNQNVSCNNCSICLDNYSIGDCIRTLPCIHHFHSKCVDKWLKMKPLCPICKLEVF